MVRVSGWDGPRPAEPAAASAGDPFVRELAVALNGAAHGDFGRVRIALSDRAEARGLAAPQRAICLALLGLTARALEDDVEARRLSRRALAGARRRNSDGPLQRRSRRVARALVAYARALTADCDPTVPVLLRDYAAFLTEVAARVARRSPGPLTPVETEVVRLLAAGRNATQIATQLGRSPHTIRTHLRNIRRRLNTRGREETLARAGALGLFEGKAASPYRRMP